MKTTKPLSEIPANLPGQFSLYGQIFLHWTALTLKGLGEFQDKNSRHIRVMIYFKNVDFKTRDFSPLMK